jgi:cytochrome c oxidase assembly factor CtaG
VRFSYLALVQDKKKHVRFTGKCMMYSLCQLPAQFSMLFLFKIKQLELEKQKRERKAELEIQELEIKKMEMLEKENVLIVTQI